jgi:chitosanase
MISAQTKEKILSITSVFETSQLLPKYDVLVVLKDGPGGQPQITYGKHQTTEFGNLKALIKMYIDSCGKYSKELLPYLSSIGVTPLHANNAFKYLLKMAGTDYIMHKIQDRFFNQYYWNPAYDFFSKHGFTQPLSMLVIYDSYIHSGGVPVWLRNGFSEKTPSNGGDETKWVVAYVKARDYWLENHKRKILRNTDYRTDCFLDCIKKCNWDLRQPVVCQFNMNDKKKWITIP